MDELKRCNVCKYKKLKSDFWRGQSACKICQLKQNKKYKHAYEIKKLYGLSLPEYQDLYAKQGGKCAVCNTDFLSLAKRPSVDHDHKTGKIRGLICNNCNAGMGLLKDSYEICLNAAMYLKYHSEE